MGGIAAAEFIPSLVSPCEYVWAYVKENAGSCVQLIVPSAVLRDPIW